MALFEQMAKEMYECGMDVKKVVHDISVFDRKIVKYVGGCCVGKIQKQMRRHGDHDIKLETFMCLDLLIEDRQDKTDDMTDRSDSSRVRGRPEDRQLTGDMTEDLDRGGLTKVTQEAWEMFLSMENVFRDVTGASNFGAFNTESEFARRCDSDVSSSFFNIIGSDETASAAVSRQVLEDTFDRIIKLYFKIRINHKCKQLMEQVKVQWREKALRKRLSNKS